jgi:hypothetical protein
VQRHGCLESTKLYNSTVFDLKTFTLPVVNLGTADASGLVADPNNPGVFYRPGVVNIDAAQPPGTPEVRNINWGVYGAVQATPNPTQVINNIAPTPTIGKWEETFIHRPKTPRVSNQRSKTQLARPSPIQPSRNERSGGRCKSLTTPPVPSKEGAHSAASFAFMRRPRRQTF